MDEVEKVLLFFNGNAEDFSGNLSSPMLIARKDGLDATLKVSQDRLVQDFLEHGE